MHTKTLFNFDLHRLLFFLSTSNSGMLLISSCKFVTFSLSGFNNTKSLLGVRWFSMTFQFLKCFCYYLNRPSAARQEHFPTH